MKPLNECKIEYNKDIIGKVATIVDLIGDKDISIGPVDGNGMTNLGINNKDLVFISYSAVPKLGDVVMVNVPQKGPMIRQILFDEKRNKYWLRASGTDPREDIFVNKPQIVGVVTHLLRDVRKSN